MQHQAQPLVTVYRPVKDGDRWLARADIVAGGERIELQATASDALAKKAANWYSQAAEWAGKYVQYADGAPSQLGVGAFGELPAVATELGQTLSSIPRDEAVIQATDLVSAAASGNQVALQRIAQVEAAAATEPRAAQLHNAICMVRDAIHSGAWQGWTVGAIIGGVMGGDHGAAQAYTALRRLSGAAPARIRYSVDDYCACGDGSCVGDIIGAALDELATPSRSPLRRVKPLQYRVAIDAFRNINMVH